MKRQRIGSISQGIDGSDEYFLLTLTEDDAGFDEVPFVALEYAEDKFLALVYDRGRGPGTQFCSSVLVSPVQHRSNEFIGIACVRYDI